MKVEERGVYHKKYDGYCTKQWVKIPKAIWTSLILSRRFMCWTFSSKAYLMKDDVNDGVPNKTPKL
jgi:hypothetical protein